MGISMLRKKVRELVTLILRRYIIKNASKCLERFLTQNFGPVSVSSSRLNLFSKHLLVNVIISGDLIGQPRN